MHAILPISPATVVPPLDRALAGKAPSASGSTPADRAPLRKTFDSFVGGAFYGQMLKAMRSTVGEPAYFHGGRAEEIFREHLDQVLAERMSEATAGDLTGPMFELFQLQSRPN